MSAPAAKLTPNFFRREADGTVRVRIKFRPEEASLYEEAAGDTPVMLWIHQTLNRAAAEEVEAARAARPDIAPPT